MSRFSPWRALGTLFVAAALQAASVAHEGHDHGDEAPAAALPALSPRAEAAGDLFELLVVADGAQLVLWVDRFASNEPVTGARVEVEGAGWKADAAAAADGSYRVALPRALPAGPHPLVFTLQAGPDADLLEATLVVPPAVAAAAPAGPQGGIDLRLLAAGAVALLALVMAMQLWRRRRPQHGAEAA